MVNCSDNTFEISPDMLDGVCVNMVVTSKLFFGVVDGVVLIIHIGSSIGDTLIGVEGTFLLHILFHQRIERFFFHIGNKAEDNGSLGTRDESTDNILIVFLSTPRFISFDVSFEECCIQCWEESLTNLGEHLPATLMTHSNSS